MLNIDNRVKPLLKWAGGKSMLLPFMVQKFFNKDFDKDIVFIEPFIGSASVALCLQFPKMILNDKNIKLINYPMTKDHWVCKTLSHN